MIRKTKHKKSNIRKATKKQKIWPDSVISGQVREGNSDGPLSKHDALQTDNFNLLQVYYSKKTRLWCGLLKSRGCEWITWDNKDVTEIVVWGRRCVLQSPLTPELRDTRGNGRTKTFVVFLSDELGNPRRDAVHESLHFKLSNQHSPADDNQDCLTEGNEFVAFFFRGGAFQLTRQDKKKTVLSCRTMRNIVQLRRDRLCSADVTLWGAKASCCWTGGLAGHLTRMRSCRRSWRALWRRPARHTWGTCSPAWKCRPLSGQTASLCSPLKWEERGNGKGHTGPNEQ